MAKGRKENLIDAAHRTEDELREMTRKGGIRSGEVRRRKKSMREALEMMLFKTELPEQTKQMLKAEGVKDMDDLTHQMVVTRSLIAKAEAGDVQAYNAICAMIGEKPAEKMELSGDLVTKFRIRHTKRENNGLISHSEDEIDD